MVRCYTCWATAICQKHFNTRPSPVGNMHFEGHQNMNQMRSPFVEKGEVCSSFLQKELNTIVLS